MSGMPQAGLTKLTAKPARETYRIIKVLDQSGNSVAGLQADSFEVVARVQASPEHIARPFAHDAAFVYMGNGYYDVAFNLPTEPGLWTLKIEHAEHRVWHGQITNETHGFDSDEPTALSAG